jgi:hypothetical protein
MISKAKSLFDGSPLSQLTCSSAHCNAINGDVSSPSFQTNSVPSAVPKSSLSFIPSLPRPTTSFNFSLSPTSLVIRKKEKDEVSMRITDNEKQETKEIFEEEKLVGEKAEVKFVQGRKLIEIKSSSKFKSEKEVTESSDDLRKQIKLLQQQNKMLSSTLADTEIELKKYKQMYKEEKEKNEQLKKSQQELLEKRSYRNQNEVAHPPPHQQSTSQKRYTLVVKNIQRQEHLTDSEDNKHVLDELKKLKIDIEEKDIIKMYRSRNPRARSNVISIEVKEQAVFKKALACCTTIPSTTNILIEPYKRKYLRIKERREKQRKKSYSANTSHPTKQFNNTLLRKRTEVRPRQYVWKPKSMNRSQPHPQQQQQKPSSSLQLQQRNKVEEMTQLIKSLSQTVQQLQRDMIKMKMEKSQKEEKKENVIA